MHIRNTYELLNAIDNLYEYLHGKGFEFDAHGFPVFRKGMFLNEWPELVIPYSQRKNKNVVNREKTLLCFFDRDNHLYPRLAKVLGEISEYKPFMGVVGLDITVTEDMDPEWQQLNILANHLFLAVLAANNIKIVFNTRNGGLDYREVFMNIPTGVMCASGFLGCELLKKEFDFKYLEKILFVLPDKLVLYGKHDYVAEDQLDCLGIPYKTYMDFHRLCQKEVRNG